MKTFTAILLFASAQALSLNEPPETPAPSTTDSGAAADVEAKQALVDAINTLGWGRGNVDPVILKVMGKYVWPDYDWQEVNDV